MGGIAPIRDQDNPTNRALNRSFDDIETKRVDWLWRTRFASKANVIGGQPGVGKSQLSASFIAIVTTGGRWPDRTPCEPGSAIIITSEDDAADTIKPRLLAAGADTSKVRILDAVQLASTNEAVPWTLDHVEELEGLIKQQRDTKLVVIDPISAYLGNNDGHNTAEVRGILAPLQSLADRRKVCILMITHLNKSIGGGAVERFNGSTAFVAVSRSAWLIGQDPQDADTRVMVPVKNNLGDDKTAFSYHIEGCSVEDNIETSKVVWDGVSELTADDVLRGPGKSIEDPDNQSAKAQAARFLIEQLGDGRKLSTQIYKLADEAGIAEKTLKRAKKEVGVQSFKDGAWYMQLADRESTGPTDPAINT